MRSLYTLSPALVLPVKGDGYWSRPHQRPDYLLVTGLELGFLGRQGLPDAHEDNPYGGELRVHFDAVQWITSRHGLVYTDKTFDEALRGWFNTQGIACDSDALHGSEMGMQGDDYVSFDASAAFAAAVIAKMGSRADGHQHSQALV